MNIDHIIGRCTADDLRALAKAAIEDLTDTDLFKVLDDALTSDQKGECVARWESAP